MQTVPTLRIAVVLSVAPEKASGNSRFWFFNKTVRRLVEKCSLFFCSNQFAGLSRMLHSSITRASVASIRSSFTVIELREVNRQLTHGRYSSVRIGVTLRKKMLQMRFLFRECARYVQRFGFCCAGPPTITAPCVEKKIRTCYVYVTWVSFILAYLQLHSPACTMYVACTRCLSPIKMVPFVCNACISPGN